MDQNKSNSQINNTIGTIKDFLKNKKVLIAATVGIFLLIPLVLLISSETKTGEDEAGKTNVVIDGTLMKVSPADSAYGVGIFQEIQVSFEQAVTEEEKGLAYISLSPDVEGEQTWSSGGKTLILKPTTPLLSEKTYTATVFIRDTSYSWTFTTTTSEDVSPEDEIKAQEVADKNYLEEEAKIESAYPWLDKLPLEAPNYFFYFDVERASFVGQLYPKQASRNSQETAMKAEIMQKLKDLSIPTENYPFEWEVTPE